MAEVSRQFGGQLQQQLQRHSIGVASELRSGSSAGLGGHLVELSAGPASAALTMCAHFLRQAQERAEPCAWVATGPSLFFPPDLAAAGIDLEALPLIRVDKGLQAAQAAEILLRSGSFAVLVLDLGEQQNFSLAVQTRLRSLARRHDAAVLLLTRRQRVGPSLGPLISLQLECSRERVAAARYRCSLWPHKDKLKHLAQNRRPWRHVELCRGPDGLH